MSAIKSTYELDKARDAYVVRDADGRELTEFFEDEWEAQQFCANGMTRRIFKIVQRRRYVLVAEDLGCGDFTARWFFDKTNQRWYLAESWQRPNVKRPLCDRNADRIAGIILRSKIVRG